MEPFELRCDDGTVLRGDARGDGPGVLLLHGGGQTRHSWGATAEHLAEDGWRALAVDLRGHGDSDRSPEGDYSLPRFAADAAQLAAALPEPPVMVGASLGGMASLAALGEEPRLASGLVLVDIAHRFELSGANRVIDFMAAKPSGFADPGEAAAAVAAYLPHRRRPVDESGVGKNLRRSGERWAWHWDRRLLEEIPAFLEPGRYGAIHAELRSALAGFEAPVLLVRGGLSDVVSEEIGAEFLELARDGRIVEVPGAGHMVAGDDNDAFCAAIRDFLAEQEPLRCR